LTRATFKLNIWDDIFKRGTVECNFLLENKLSL